MVQQQIILDRLAEGVREMDEGLKIEAAHQALANHVDTLTAINQGLAMGMNQVGGYYEEEYFVPELLLCSDAGLDILILHIQPISTVDKHKVVIGIIEGDTHDIGKNLVKLMLEVSDFDINNLGRDFPAADFIAKVNELSCSEASCIGLLNINKLEYFCPKAFRLGQKYRRCIIG